MSEPVAGGPKANTPTLWIDSDALPEAIRDIIIRAAMRCNLTAKFVANIPIRLPRSPLLIAVLVPKGIDVADNMIVEQVQSGDLIISADVPLAALAIPKGATVLDPRGDTLTAANISERASVRRSAIQERLRIQSF